MDLESFKIPIIENINDVPSVLGDPVHPNASLICSNFNAAIDGLSSPSILSPSAFIFIIDPAETVPDNITTFKDTATLVKYLKSVYYSNFNQPDIIIQFAAGRHDIQLLDLNFYLLQEKTITITSLDPLDKAILRITSFTANSPVIFDDVIIERSYFLSSQIHFLSTVTLTAEYFNFLNCIIEFEGDGVGSDQVQIEIVNSTFHFLTTATAVTFNFILSKSTFIHEGDITQQFNTTINFDINTSTVLINDLYVDRLNIYCTNSLVVLEKCNFPLTGIFVNSLNCNLTIKETTIYNTETNRMQLFGSTLNYIKSFTTGSSAGFNHTTLTNSTVIAETDPTNIIPFLVQMNRSPLPLVWGSVVFEDGVQVT